MHSRSDLSRRALLTLFGAGVAVFPIWAEAQPVAAAENGAILVRKPAQVMLIAIARAGNRLVAVGVHGVIIYSDDNGQKWKQSSVPVDVTLTCVGFATPQIGWAAGHAGTILATTDGGVTWRQQLNGIQAAQITSNEAQNMTPDEQAAPGGTRAVRRAAAITDSGPVFPFLSMFVFGPAQVLVMGADRLAMMSTDGGKTWVDWSLHIYDPFSHNIYAAARSGDNIFLAGEVGMVFCSTDGGKTFPAVTSPTTVTWFGVLGARDGNVLVYGVAGNLYRSHDNGATWTQVNLGTQDNLTAGRILQSGDVLIATEAGAMYVSKDNGVTFSPVSGVPPTPIYDFAQAPDESLVLVGAGGVVDAPDLVLS